MAGHYRKEHTEGTSKRPGQGDILEDVASGLHPEGQGADHVDKSMDRVCRVLFRLGFQILVYTLHFKVIEWLGKVKDGNCRLTHKATRQDVTLL